MKLKVLIFLFLILFSLSSLVFATGSTNINVTVNNAVGEIGWNKGSAAEGTILATGWGTPPDGVTNPAQARAMARESAIVLAQRELLKQINGVSVDSETIVENMIVKCNLVKGKISGIVQNYKVVNESLQPDGSYIVTIAINMYGLNSLADVVYNNIKPPIIKKFPQAQSVVVDDPLPGKYYEKNYSGIIIDAREVGLISTFSPRIYDQNGNIIYSNNYIDPDYAIKHGMVEYTNDYSMFNAAANGTSRAGSNPIVVKAIRLVDHKHNVVISNEDARKILSVHENNNFLANCAVVFAK